MDPIDYISFAAKIKEKYPAYKDMDDLTLARKMVDKFPEYKASVTFDTVKKKVETDASAGIPKATGTTSESDPQKLEQSGGTSGSSVPGIKSWSDIATKETTDQLKEAPRAAVENPIKTKASDFVIPEQKFDFEAAPEKEKVGPVSKTEIQRQKDFDELVIAEPGSKEQAEIIQKKKVEKEIEDNERNTFLSEVTDDLIIGNEEDVTKKLQDKYGKYGFTFEEKGLGDAMRVTSKYGDPIDIDLDVSEVLTGKIAQQSTALKDYLWKNKSNTKESSIVEVLKTMRDQPGAVSEKMYSKLSKGIDSQITELSQSQTKLAENIKLFEAAAKDNGTITPEQYKEYTSMLKEYNNGIPEARKLEKLRKEINISAGLGLKQVISRNEKLGTTAGALGNLPLRNLEEILSGAVTLGFVLVDTIDEAASLGKYTPAYQQMFGESDVVEMSKTYQDLSKRSDFRKEEVKKNREKIEGALVAELGSTTSKEYMESDDRGFLMQAAMGVAGSSVSMLTGFTGMALQSFDAVAEEWVDNPEYEDMPLSDLLVVGGSVAIIQGALENYGLTSLLSDNPAGKTFINKVLKNTFGKVVGKTSGESFNKLIAAETNSLIKNGTVKIIGGAIVEGETGALQEISDIGIKSIYNKLEGKEIFDTPETFGEAVDQVKEAAKMEAAGAVLLKGGMLAPKMINDGIKKSDMEAPLVEALHYMSESPELKRSMIKTLKTEVLQKRMTLDEAKSKLADFETMTTTMREIPMDITDKSAAFNLIIEKNKIEKEIEGKNPALTVTKKERIAEINTELGELATGVKEEVKETPPPTKKPVDQVSLHTENGGSSISQTGEDLIGKPGFAVSTHTDKTKTVKGKEITQEDLDQYKEANKETLKDPNNFVGTWYDSKSDQTYIDISTRVENKQEAIDLAKANNQKAIFDLESMKEIDTGGTGEVKQETKKVKQETTATQQATTENLKEQFKEVKTEREQKVIRAANSVVKSLSDIPGVKVFIHNTTDAYNSAIARTTGESKESIDAETQKSLGEYISGTGEIHINLDNKATDAATVYHEAFHAVFEAKGIESGAAKEMVDGLKKIVKDKKLLGRIDDFVSLYESGEQNEEFMAETVGILSDAAKTLDANGLHKLINLINKIATKILGKPLFKTTASRQEVLDFINKTSTSLRTGVEVDTGVVKKTTTSRKKQLIPTDQAAKLTEDKDGNYYFENFGFIKKTTLKPSLATGAGLQTSKDERAAINSVGGLTMLYSMEGQTETGVGDVKHKVLIPKEEVYHIQSDPNGYYEEAKRQFNEVRPGQAFNSNYQSAWITKVANDNGYTIALANWRGNELRAQTTLNLTPVESDIEFKEKVTDEYKVGDEVNVRGVDVKITKIDGDIITYKGEKDSGTLNIKNNKRSIRKKRIFNKKANKINTAVTLLKEKSKTDKEIREELKGEWYTDREIDSAIEEYNLKNEGIWTGQGKGKIERSILSFKKKYFSARKFLPKSAFKSKENKEATIAANLNSVDKNVKDFNRAYSKYTGDKDKLTADFDAYIRGDKAVTLPEDVVAIGVSMRNQIDALSQSLIDSGIVDGESADNIANNIGKYLTRSYKVYDRKNWKNEVEDEVLQKAKNMLRGQYTSIAKEIAAKESRDLDVVLDELVDGKIDNMLSKDGASKFISGSKLGSKDVSVLKEKTDIPLEIRALMGEYSDPALNYAKTVLKLSSLAANHKFLKEVKAAGKGVFLFTEPRGVYNVKIAGDTSKTMNPLNGMYTTKEIAGEFEAQPQDVGALLENYMKVISTVKWAKTIGSIATHSKNITGNLGFVWLNGHSDLSEMRGSYRTVKNDFSSRNKGDLREKMNHYISLGIVKQSAGLGEIMDMFKDADWDTSMATRLTNKELNAWQKSKRFVLKGKKVLEDAYQAEDDFFKIVAYENELSRYSKAMFGKNKSELSKEERTEVDEVVAEIVKNTYPTYSRVPDAIQKIRRFPLIGNFISFQAESYRTAVNTALMTSSELSSENPAIRKIGAKRLTGAITYLSAKTAILSYFSLAAGTGLAGFAGGLFNDDEEDQKGEDIRKFIAPWSEKSDLLILEAGNGKVKYIDFSASDPHGAMHKLVNAMLSGDNTLDAVKNGAIELIEPFVGVEITTAAANSLVNNKDSYGRPIWNVTDNKADQSKDIIAFVWKLIQPGTVTSINRVIDSEDRGTEIGAALSGFRVIETNVEDQFGYKIKGIGENLPNAKGDYNSAYRKYEAGEITKTELTEAYKKSNKKVKEIYGEMIDAYNSAERLGVKKDVLSEKLSQFGVSKYIIEEIQKNKIEDMRTKDYKRPSSGRKHKRVH